MRNSFLHYTFITAGIGALACILPILYLENQGKPQSPYHFIQLLCCFLCFLSSCSFIWSTKGDGLSATKIFAIVACLLSGGWVGFFVYVFVKISQAGAWVNWAKIKISQLISFVDMSYCLLLNCCTIYLAQFSGLWDKCIHRAIESAEVHFQNWLETQKKTGVWAKRRSCFYKSE